MSLELTVLVASIVGAMLFFFSGLLGGRAIGERPAPAVPPPARDSERERALEEQLARVKREREEARTTAERERGELVTWASRAADLERRLEELAAERHAENERLRRELGDLREDKAVVLADLEEANRRLEAIGDPEAQEGEIDALRLELAAARARVEELAAVRDEITGLRREAKDVDELRKVIRSVSEENLQLRAQGFALRTQINRPIAPHPGGLDALVTRLSRTEGVRAVTLADDLGFPIAGSGTELEGLAAMCSLLLEVGARARTLLPLGALRRIVLEAEHDVTVSVCPLVRPDLRISLAALAIGPGPDRRQLWEGVQQAADVFRRAAEKGELTP